MKIQLKRSNVLENDAAKEPTAEQMEFGELAVNYNEEDPSIYLKDADGTIIRIAGKDAVGNIISDIDGYPDLNDDEGATLDERYLKLGENAGEQIVLSPDFTRFTGNISTPFINTTDGAKLANIQITTGQIATSGGTLTVEAGGSGSLFFKTKNANSIYRFYSGDGAFYGDLKLRQLTNNQSYNAPDKSGTLALTSDIDDISDDYLSLVADAGPQTVLSTEKVTFSGDIETTGIELSGSGSSNSIEGDGVYISSEGSLGYLSLTADKNIGITATDSGSFVRLRGNNGQTSYRFTKAGQSTIEGYLDFESLTGDRTYTYPDESGTIALINDIPSVAGNYLSLAADAGEQSVESTDLTTFKGAVTSEGLVTGNSGKFGNITTSGGRISGTGEVNIEAGGTSRLVFRTKQSGGQYRFFQVNAAGNHGNFRFENLTDTRNYDFPDAGGTLALTDDIPTIAGNYLSLASDAGDQIVASTGTTSFNGYVGIGTDTPQSNLDILGNAPQVKIKTINNVKGVIVLDNERDSGANSGAILGNWYGNNVSSIGFVNGSNNTSKDNGKITFSTSESGYNAVNRLTITEVGNVGIGTPGTANALLEVRKDVEGDLGGEIRITNQTTDSPGTTVALNLQAGSNTGRFVSIVGEQNVTRNKQDLVIKTPNGAVAEERLRVTAEGNVGIGTDLPAELLEVNGTAKATILKGGAITIEGAVVTSAGSLTLEAGADNALFFKTKNINSDYRFYNSDATLYGNLKFKDLTASRTYLFPDKAGTIALTSDIPGITNSYLSLDVGAGAQIVESTGLTTFKGAVTSEGTVTGNVGIFGDLTTSENILSSTGAIVISAGGTGNIRFQTKGDFHAYRFYKSDESAYGEIRFRDLTANRYYQMPDAGGTIALIGDVEGNYLSLDASSPAQNVESTNLTTFKGAVTSEGVVTGDSGKFGGITTEGNSIISKAALTLEASGTGKMVFKGKDGNGDYRFYQSNAAGKYANLRFENLTANRNHLFPNASGTLALKTDIDSANYLSLAADAGVQTVASTDSTIFSSTLSIGPSVTSDTAKLGLLYIADNNNYDPLVDGRLGGNIFLRRSDTQADNAYAGSIVFSKISGNNAGSAIAGIQTSTNTNTIGLAFLVHDSTVANSILKEALRIKHDGYVGIGVTDPQEMLDVNGGIRGNNVYANLVRSKDYSTNISNCQMQLSASGRVTFGGLLNSSRFINTSPVLLQGNTSQGVDIFSTYGTRWTQLDTVGVINHYLATGQTNADSQAIITTLDTVRGFYVTDRITNITGATDRRSAYKTLGFVSAISSPTGAEVSNGFSKYNLYIEGNADNYFKGRVGIGTETPSSNLAIDNGSTASGGIIISDSVAADTQTKPSIKFTGIDGDHCRIRSFRDANAGAAGAALFFETGGSVDHPGAKMVILGNGNVGIGTTAPEAKLEILESALPQTVGSEVTAGIFRLPVKSGGGTYADLDFGITRIAQGNSSSQCEQFIRCSRGGIGIDRGSSTAKQAISLTYSNDSYVTSNNGLTLNTDGNVGIGTTEPVSKLAVIETIDGEIFRLQRRGGVNNGVFKVSTNDSSRQISIETSGTRSFNLGFVVNSRNLLQLDTGGNVGIGTTEPGSTLHVFSDAGTPARFQSSTTTSQVKFETSEGSNLYVGGEGPNHFVVKNKSSGDVKERLRITNEGNVGIGTTDPQAKLDVNGTIKATGIQFPAATINLPGLSPVVDSNLLDDYEEGTFTPKFTSSTTDDAVYAANSTAGVYIKIGNVVQIQIKVKTTSGTLNASSNTFGMVLPFTSCSIENSTSCFSFGRNSVLTGFNQLGARIGKSTTSMTFYNANASIKTDTAGVSLTNKILEVSGTYIIN